MVEIHGIPKSMFHIYVDYYMRGTISQTHSNAGSKHLQLSTIQAVDTIAAIIDECTNQMPHQMCVTQSH